MFILIIADETSSPDHTEPLMVSQLLTPKIVGPSPSVSEQISTQRKPRSSFISSAPVTTAATTVPLTTITTAPQPSSQNLSTLPSLSTMSVSQLPLQTSQLSQHSTHQPTTQPTIPATAIITHTTPLQQPTTSATVPIIPTQPATNYAGIMLR